VQPDTSTVLIINLPRETAVEHGLAAARSGFWPVPLFNCADGPAAVLSVRQITDRLLVAGRELASLRLPDNAPPAFLLDSKRMSPDRPLSPGSFDNRYLIFPQDFPSAAFLKTQGILQVLVLRSEHPPHQLEDLNHVLLRWRQGGIPIFEVLLENPGDPQPMNITVPSRFRSLFHRMFALSGLRRNSAGGFGGIIPDASSGG